MNGAIAMTRKVLIVDDESVISNVVDVPNFVVSAILPEDIFVK